jgi:hypothetical protein
MPPWPSISAAEVIVVPPRSLPLQPERIPERSPDFPGNLRGVYRGDLEEGSQSENPPSRSAPSILSRRTRSPCSSGPRLGSSATSTRTRILRNRSLSSSAAWRLPKGGTAVCSRKRKKTRTAAPPSRRCRLEKAKSYFPPGSKTLSARKRCCCCTQGEKESKRKWNEGGGKGFRREEYLGFGQGLQCAQDLHCSSPDSASLLTRNFLGGCVRCKLQI